MRVNDDLLLKDVYAAMIGYYQMKDYGECLKKIFEEDLETNTWRTSLKNMRHSDLQLGRGNLDEVLL